MLANEIVEPWLPPELVDSLRDLVPRGVAESGEKRQQLARKTRCRVVAENDGRQGLQRDLRSR